MKNIKKIFSVVIVFALLVSMLSVSAFAAKEKGTDYPYVFVHGMGGWGPDNKFYELSPYWGGGLGVGSGTDLIKILNENGIEAYAPSVGPLNSAWDRACELYAQLTGTVVDYGEAHSKAHGHDRYGFNYEGKATMGEPWNLKDKINLVGHSFGGETVRLFTSLLYYGSEEEIAATGEDTSELFKGGHDCVHSCITLSSPHNGSQVANQLVDPQITMLLMSAAVNIIGCVLGNNFLVFSFQLGHFGLTPKQDEFRAKPSLQGIKGYAVTNDNCGYDMTLRGAAELNAKIKLAPNTYYYSYSTAATKEGLFGLQWPIKTLNPIFYISSAMLGITAGSTVDGVKIEGDWAVNDGIVPLASALYPLCDAETARDYEDALAAGETIEPGRWYYLDTMYGTDHFDFCGTKDYPTTFEDFYFGMIETANSR
ncbi:MAG: hypothetical protein IJA02_10635 [Clostridia bacterium]|nr:hypothetical protein [Clostridia bacterium]